MYFQNNAVGRRNVVRAHLDALTRGPKCRQSRQLYQDLKLCHTCASRKVDHKRQKHHTQSRAWNESGAPSSTKFLPNAFQTTREARRRSTRTRHRKLQQRRIRVVPTPFSETGANMTALPTARGLFRQLLRARAVAFRGDQTALNASREEIRNHFQVRGRQQGPTLIHACLPH